MLEVLADAIGIADPDATLEHAEFGRARTARDRGQLDHRGVAPGDDDVLALQGGIDQLGEASLGLGDIHASYTGKHT